MTAPLTQMQLDLFDGSEEENLDHVFWTAGGSAPYTKEVIVESAFRYFREAGFPYRDLPPHVCMERINKLAATPPDKLPQTLTGYDVADTYHPHRFSAHAERMRSPVEVFESDHLLRLALERQLEHTGPIGSSLFAMLQLVSGTQPCANFRPGFACHVYRAFCEPGDTVLDTSTGYGGRLVGFMASGVAGRYIGVDPNTKTHAGNRRMADELGYGESVELHNLPAEDVSRETVEGRCDFAFTSPPYFRKEIYSDETTQSRNRYPTIDQWCAGFLAPMMALQYQALKPGAFAAVNVAKQQYNYTKIDLAALTVKAAKAAGFVYSFTDNYSLKARFGRNGPGQAKPEPVLVFRK